MQTLVTTETLYLFDELSDDAKAVAVERVRRNDEFYWSREWRESLEGFLAFLGLTNRDVDWAIGAWVHSYAHLTPHTSIDHLPPVDDPFWNKALSASETCSWTGYCGDAAFAEILTKRWTYSDPRELVNACLGQWAHDFQQDMEFWYGEESVREDAEANGWMFRSGGAPVYQPDAMALEEARLAQFLDTFDDSADLILELARGATSEASKIAIQDLLDKYNAYMNTE